MLTTAIQSSERSVGVPKLTIEAIPDEIVILFFRKLYFRDYLALATTCRRFHQLSLDSHALNFHIPSYTLQSAVPEIRALTPREKIVRMARIEDRFRSFYKKICPS